VQNYAATFEPGKIAMRISKQTLLVSAAAGIGILVGQQALRRSNLARLRGKIVVITGGSRGLGLVLARTCLQYGANVAICARDREELVDATHELRERFGAANVLGAVCDVSRPREVFGFIQAVVRRFGGIDVLINNAGVISVGPWELMRHADYKESLDTHMWGSLYTIEAAHAVLARRGGRIVNITSIGGKISVPHLLPYSVGKFALVALSEGLGAELAKEGISVTTVCPGLMRTGSPRNAWFKGHHREEYAWFSIGDSLPIVSVSVDSAARRILDAAMRRKRELIFPVLTRAAILAHDLAPRTTLRLLGLIDHLLPAAGGIGATWARGYESHSEWSPSALTQPSDKAALRNNEMRDTEVTL
jgi:NAD(P)-dependent dehydrogenase (short-subunit alcohol dehydrogenase family)